MIKTRTLLTGLFLLAIAGICHAASGDRYMAGGEYRVADNLETVHDAKTGTTVRASAGQCVRTKWTSAYDECATSLPAAAPVAHNTVTQFSREERTVYAGFNQTTLSPEMKAKLDALATLVKSEQAVKGVRIVGYADRIGNPRYNEKLSQKRAENVRQYLVSKGVVKASVADTRWLGASDPVTNCPDTLSHAELIACLQQDRRVEVEVDYAPDTQASR